MLKFIGAVAVAGAVALGAAVYFGWANVDASFATTTKAKTQLQHVRNEAADVIRGNDK